MTQEEKDLLLKDLCARLPYGVKLKITLYEDMNEVDGIGTVYQLNSQSVWVLEDENERCIEYNKPYLFPMSNMTEEQKREYDKIIYRSIELHHREYSDIVEIDLFDNLQEFYHKNHFDYRGLIPMGLANDATGLNIY